MVPTRSWKVAETAPAPKSEWKSSEICPDFKPPITSVNPPEPKSVVSTSAALITNSARAVLAEMSEPFKETSVPVTTYLAKIILLMHRRLQKTPQPYILVH